MTYVLDITHDRIKSAMQNLGIEAEELKVKSIEDFNDRNLSEEVKKLRYNFYNRKQQELVRHIRSTAREEIMRILAKKKQAEKMETDAVVECEYIETPVEEELEKVRKKNNQVISKYFTDVQDTLRDDEQLSSKLIRVGKLRENMRTSVSRGRIKFKELKNKQQMNYEKTMKDKQSKSKNYSRADAGQYKPEKEARKKKLSWSPVSVSKGESIFESEISAKIKMYEEKMDKSKALYNTFLNNKKKNISKLLKKSLNNSKIAESFKQSDANEKLNRIIQKAHSAEKRRGYFLKSMTERRLRQQALHDGRRAKAQLILDEQKILEDKKVKELEDKMKRSQDMLTEKNNIWCRELELRNELQRLKDEEIMMNAERKKRIL